MKESKCEHCGNWTDGSLKNCNYCRGVLGEEYHKEKENLKKLSPTGLPFIKIDPNASWYEKIGQHMIRFGQLIFFGIISIVAAIASSTVH